MGSGHDLVMMNFRVHLKKVSKSKNTRLRFDLEKLKDPAISEEFHAVVSEKLAPLLLLDEDIETITNNLNTVMTETASKVLGTNRRKKSLKTSPTPERVIPRFHRFHEGV